MSLSETILKVKESSNHTNFNDHYPSIPSLNSHFEDGPIRIQYEIRTSMYI